MKLSIKLPWKKKNETHLERNLLQVGETASFAYNEAYRTLRTNLEFSLAADEKDSHVIVISSSVPGEGKSNVAFNIAQMLAANGNRVVVVDCDLRKGTLGSRYLHTKRSATGVTNYVAGKADLRSVVYRVSENDSLYIVPTGPLPPNPSELLSGRRMGMFFEELRKVADYVIVDTPPVSLVTDATILTRYSDGVILVVRSNFTVRPEVELSKKNLEQINARVLGVILNDYTSKTSGKKDGYYYSYSYYGYDEK